MRLQPASKKEVKRIALGTAVCDAVMIAVLFVLSLLGVGTFDYRVFVGAAGGSAVAIANFAVMCLTIQKATEISDQKSMKSFIQGSYNGRLLLQAAWVVAAIMSDHIGILAGCAPLLFPNMVILYLQKKGTLVDPSERKNPPAGETEDLEDRPGSFEV